MTKQEIIDIIDGTFSEDTKLNMLTKVIDSSLDWQNLKELIADPTYGKKLTNYLRTLKAINKPYSPESFNIDDIVKSKTAFTYFFGSDGKSLEHFIIHIDNDINEVLNTDLDVASSREYGYRFSTLKKIDEALRKISTRFYNDDLYIHKRILEFYEGRFEKNRSEENGKFVRGSWKEISTKENGNYTNGHLDMNEFYEKFMNIQSIREDKFSNMLD